MTQEPHLNAMTTSPKVTILGTVKEVALSAETMTAKFQTSLSCKFRLLHLSSHHRPCSSPWHSAHLSKLEKVLASRTADKRFLRRRICTQPTKALLNPTVRHTRPIWYTTRQSFYGRVATDFIYDVFKPSSKVVARRRREVRRDEVATRGAVVTRGAGARSCWQSSFLMSCEPYKQNVAITQKRRNHAKLLILR